MEGKSIVSLRFDVMYDCTPPTVLLGLLLCPWMQGIVFQWVQHSPVDDCLATSCCFAVLSGEDEHMPYSAMTQWDSNICPMNYFKDWGQCTKKKKA